MSTNLSFSIFCILLVVGFIVIYNIRKRDRLKQRADLAELWPKFLQAKERRDFQAIIKLGVLLFENPLLEPEESRVIEAFIRENIKKFPQLKELEVAESRKASRHRRLTWFELFEREKKNY